MLRPSVAFKILNNRKPQDLYLYNQVFSLWKSGWGREFDEQKLSGIDTVHSDALFQCDEIGTLLLDKEPIGFVLYTYLDLRNECHLNLEYVQAYPEEGVQFLREHFQNVMSLTYFFIDKKFRGQREVGTKLSEYLLAKSFDYYRQRKDSSILVGMPLCSRKFNQICTDFGMELLSQKPTFKHDVPVEFVYLKKEKLNLEKLNRTTSDVEGSVIEAA